MKTNPIKAYRDEQGLTQSALANALGVKQSTVAGWESGHRPVASDLVGRVSAHTGIPLHVLRPELFPVPADAA